MPISRRATSGVTLARLRGQRDCARCAAVTAGRFFVVDAAAARADTTAYALLRSLAHSLHPDGHQAVTRFGAVTFDAMGTLVAIEPPAPRLQRSLERRLGRDVDLARCEAAMRVEMRHYRAHCISAHDAPSLAALRLECASLLADALALDSPEPTCCRR